MCLLYCVMCIEQSFLFVLCKCLYVLVRALLQARADVAPLLALAVERVPAGAPSGGKHACIHMLHTRMHACMHAYVHTYVHTCMHACIHTDRQTDRPRCMHACNTTT